MTYRHHSKRPATDTSDSIVLAIGFNCYAAENQDSNVNNDWWTGVPHTPTDPFYGTYGIFNDSRWVMTELTDSGQSSPTWANVNTISPGNLARWAWLLPYNFGTGTLKKATVAFTGRLSSTDCDDWHFTISKGAHPDSAGTTMRSDTNVSMTAIHEFAVTGTTVDGGDRLFKAEETINQTVSGRDFLMVSMVRKGVRGGTGSSDDCDILGSIVFRIDK